MTAPAGQHKKINRLKIRKSYLITQFVYTCSCINTPCAYLCVRDVIIAKGSIFRHYKSHVKKVLANHSTINIPRDVCL